MHLRAYAKINLGLRILSKREDGYHTIETVFHRIDLFDEIACEPSPSLSLCSSTPVLPTDERNLCMKAALVLREYLKQRRGALITLTKRIPVGAGLGGGSADAATTLRALVGLWGAEIQEADLCRLALSLGSDVPYFLRAGTASATGRGELLEYFPLDLPYWIVCAYPSTHVSTAWAYGMVRPRRTAHAESLKEILLKHRDDPGALCELLQNDFEPVVSKAYPVIASLGRELTARGALLAHMSGSGSAVYGFFRSEPQAREAAASLAALYPTSLTPPGFQPA